MRRVVTSLVLLAALMSFSCAGVLHPYEGDFSCPDPDNGKCVSMKEAYDESVRGVNPPRMEETRNEIQCRQDTFDDHEVLIPWEGEKTCIQPAIQKTAEPGHKGTRDGAVPEKTDRDALHERLSLLVTKPVTPTVRPPEVMRILYLPYTTDGNTLNMLRYSYIVVGEPRWILDPALTWEDTK